MTSCAIHDVFKCDLLGLFFISVLLKLFDFILHVSKNLTQFSLEEEGLLVLLNEVGMGIVYCIGAGKHPSKT